MKEEKMSIKFILLVFLAVIGLFFIVKSLDHPSSNEPSDYNSVVESQW